MHELQRHILSQLILNQSLRFGQLKPAEIEGNLFTYHLKALLTAGLVRKRPDDRYELSAHGQLYADRVSLKNFTPRAQPKVVLLLVVINERGEYLLYRRRRQPLIGLIGFPYGHVNHGESIRQAASRELTDRTGLSADLVHRGDGYITTRQDGEMVSHVLFHLFSAYNPAGRLKTDRLELGWRRLEEISLSQLIPGVRDLATFLEENPTARFFAELTYD